MRILISNDDGIDAPGIAALATAAADFGDVIVAAPDCIQSGAGHGITVHHPLTVQRREFCIDVDGGKRIAPGFSIDGRPADCVRLAVRELIDEPVDLVLSGINDGANDGVCVFYSGTVAAAAEAAILGIPAVAFSAKMTRPAIDFAAVAAQCRGVLRRLLDVGLAAGDLVNVNIPDLTKPGWPKGVRVARMSTAELQDTYDLLDESNGQLVYKIGGDYDLGFDRQDTDSVALREGYITVTPLCVDMTRHDRLAKWLGQNWGGDEA